MLRMLMLDDSKLEQLLLRYLNENHKSFIEEYNEEELSEKISHGINVAKRYGILGLKDVLTFVGIMFTVAPGFHLQPNFHKILVNEQIPKHTKMSKIFNLDEDVFWDEAEALNDKKYWATTDRSGYPEKERA